MSKKLKVYGMLLWIPRLPSEYRASNGGCQKRVVIASTSWNKVCKHLNITMSAARFNGCETGNKEEIELALANPEKAFYQIGYTKNGCIWEWRPYPLQEN